MGMLVACGAAITKQAGIYLLVVFPFFIYFFIIKVKKDFNDIRTFLKLFGFYFLIIGIIVLPFYLYTQFKIRNSIDSSEIQFVTQGIYNGRSYLQRFIDASSKFKLLFAVFPFFAFSITDRNFRWIALFLVFPYFILWSLFYSYDIRNSAIILPFYSIGVAIGIEYIFKFRKNAIFIISIVALVILLLFLMPLLYRNTIKE
jgi:hypothetical protein